MTADPRARPARSRAKTLLRRIEKRINRMLMAVVVAILPRIYVAYMWLVWKTSTIERFGTDPQRIRTRAGKVVIALWHDEVFFVAWSFRHDHASTLASRGDFGALIARMLELCNFTVFRGGSSAGRSRREHRVLEDMVDHMNLHDGVLYGITVDGSYGPRYRLKKGVIRIAAACQAPMLVEKTWCRSYFRLPTWDRTIVPLPFNRIVHVFAGPFLPPENASDLRSLAGFGREVEDALLHVTYHARALVEGTAAPDMLESFPKRWTAPQDPLRLERTYRNENVGTPLTGTAEAQ